MRQLLLILFVINIFLGIVLPNSVNASLGWLVATVYLVKEILMEKAQ